MATEPPNPPKRSHYFRNWLSLAGLVLALGSLFAFLLLFAIDLFAPHSNPYLGILTYVVAPAFCALGLLTAGIGAWVQRRHLGKGSSSPVPHVLVIDLTRRR